MPLRTAIVVFAKPPVPGRVKTRLIGELTAEQTAAVHRACLEDTLGQLARVSDCKRAFHVAGTLGQARGLAKALRLGRRWRVGAQRGRDLGERLCRAFESLFQAGSHKVVVIGSDTPWMGRRRIRRALRLLDGADVVLGPTDDGGYYLVAARRIIPQMFRGIPWSTGRVLAKTIAALRQAGASYRSLGRDFDLDRPKDLRRAARLLRKHPACAPSLAKWLREWAASKLRRSSRRRPPARRNRRRLPAQV